MLKKDRLSLDGLSNLANKLLLNSRWINLQKITSGFIKGQFNTPQTLLFKNLCILLNQINDALVYSSIGASW